MGHIAEPKGTDFIIESQPLTDVERAELSEFIKKHKAKTEKKIIPKSKSRPKEKFIK